MKIPEQLQTILPQTRKESLWFETGSYELVFQDKGRPPGKRLQTEHY